MNRAARRQARAASGRRAADSSGNSASLDRMVAMADRHRQAGRLQQASDLYRQVLASDPRHALSLHRLGGIAYLVGTHEAAIGLIANAIAIDDTVAAYHNDLGECLRLTGAKADAVASFARALELDPELASAMSNLALLLAEAGRQDAGIDLLHRAIAREPSNPDYRINLGCLLLDAGKITAAVTELETATRLAPHDPASWLNLGNVRMRSDQPGQAAACYRAVIARDSSHVAGHLNLGLALRESGDAEAGLAAMKAARALAPDHPAVRWNEGLTHLVLGRLSEGWEGFSWRWQAGATPAHGLSLPEWDGTPLSEKRLLVHAEQGLGDTLQFVRFLDHPALAAALRVALLPQPPLAGLLAQTVRDIVSEPIDLTAFDCRAALMDLPRLLAIGGGIEPVRLPFVRPPDALAAHWAQHIGDAPGLKVGIVWQGRAAHANDRNRSIPFERVRPLTTLDRATWYSLQREAGPAPAPLIDLARGLTDMSDTAAAILALDLVIAVDTSVAHLAGALGKPVWLMLPFAPDWRWQLDRSDSPWYPTARLFRQSRAGDWDGVITEIALALAALTDDGPEASSATGSIPGALL